LSSANFGSSNFWQIVEGEELRTVAFQVAPLSFVGAHLLPPETAARSN